MSIAYLSPSSPPNDLVFLVFCYMCYSTAICTFLYTFTCACTHTHNTSYVPYVRETLTFLSEKCELRQSREKGVMIKINNNELISQLMVAKVISQLMVAKFI